MFNPKNIASLQTLTQAIWFRFLVAAVGIYGSYIYYGLLQEKLFSKDYTGKKDEKFTYSFAILLFQNIFSYLVAHAINRYYYNLKKSAMDWKTEALIGGCNFGTMISANTALSFVSFPVQALMKSSKIVSILMVSLCFGAGKSYSKKQYLTGFIITLGIVLFNLLQSKGKGDKETSFIGLGLLVFSLFCDGMLGTTQTEAKEKFGPSAFDQMESSNKYTMLFTIVFSLVTFQMGPFFFFCYRYPAIIGDLVQVAMLGTIGQVFIFYTIFNFSPFVLSILTTTRKFFTVLASIAIYQHHVNTYQWMAILMVFAGVGMELLDGAKKKHAPKHAPKLPVTKDEDGVELNNTGAVNNHEGDDAKLK